MRRKMRRMRIETRIRGWRRKRRRRTMFAATGHCLAPLLSAVLMLTLQLPPQGMPGVERAGDDIWTQWVDDFAEKSQTVDTRG